MINATFSTKDIKIALGRLSQAPGAHNKIPGLAAVRISGDIEGIWMQRNTEVARVRVRVDAEVEDEGQTAISHQHLTDCVGVFVDQRVTLTGADEYINLQSGRSKSKIKTIHEDQLIADFEPKGDSADFTIDIEWLTDAFKTISHAINRGGTDFTVNALMRTDQDDENALYILATDRKQFMACRSGDPGVDVDVMLPADAVNAIVKIFEGLKGDVAIECYENGIYIRHEDAEAFLAIAAGKYAPVTPLINRHLEAESDAAATCLKAEVIEGIRIAQVFQSDDAIIVRFYKGEVQIAGTQALGENVHSITAEVEEGDAMRINSRYFLNLLAAIKTDTVTFKKKQEVVTIEDDDRFAFIALINTTVAAPPKE